MSMASDLSWYHQLLAGASPTGVVGVICVVSAIGVAVGSLRVRGFPLGIAGVLFAGIVYAHFFWSDDVLRSLLAGPDGNALPGDAVSRAIEAIRATRRDALEFLRDFGLVLFVYSVGMQVGPRFFASLRSQGLRWNLLAIANVSLGILTAWAICAVGRMPPAAVVGVLSGAVTNTPGLAAAQEALRGIPGIDSAHGNLPGIGYAVAYPFGVLGTILTMIIVRVLFRVDVNDEARTCMRSPHSRGPAPGSMSLVKQVGEVALRGGSPAYEAWKLASDATIDRTETLATRRLVVTNRVVIGKTLARLHFREDHGVNILRAIRAEVETEPGGDYDLHYGDTLIAFGDTQGLRAVEHVVGNASKQLDVPHLVPMFITIAAGVLLGSIPSSIPNIPAPVKLGLAGGPLVAALFFGSIGRVGRLSFYLTRGANLMLREFGIVLFLSAVGLMAGGQFVTTLLDGDGWYWMAAGALITLLPLLAIALFARTVWKVNYAFLCGILAGSMTDPPALAFASSMMQTDGPAIAYGTVYPITMILRVISAQLFVLLVAAPPG